MAGEEVTDVFPIGDNESCKAKFVTEDVGENVVVDVHRNTVDFSTVDHHCRCTGFYGRSERGQENFPQLALRNPCWGAVFTGQRTAVSHVMLERGRDR